MELISFWVGFIAGVFILLHIPSCNVHLGDKIPIISKFLRKYHNQTLWLATFFAIVHVILALVGLFFGIWI